MPSIPKAACRACGRRLSSERLVPRKVAWIMTQLSDVRLSLLDSGVAPCGAGLGAHYRRISLKYGIASLGALALDAGTMVVAQQGARRPITLSRRRSASPSGLGLCLLA